MEYIIINPLSVTTDNSRSEFKCEADGLNLKNEEDVYEKIKKVRKNQFS